ncbi:hypothetical protein [Methanoculleus sp. 10]|uniref:hypothetical protein n=1 Tax=Methanoculleus sp. 10 TaxID=430615 RepID=UPI0034187C60
MATIEPPSMRAAASRMGSAAATSVPSAFKRASCGPQAAQAIVWAWCRRQDGSCISLSQAPHMGNSAIDVRSRS